MSSANNPAETSIIVSTDEVEDIEDEIFEGRIKGNVESPKQQIRLENARFQGTVEAPEEFTGENYPPLKAPENSEIAGDVSQRDFMRHANNSVAYGGHITSDSLLFDAEKSLIMGDRVQNHSGIMGEKSESSVVAAQDLVMGDTFWDHLGESLNPNNHRKNWLSALKPSRMDKSQVADDLTVFTPEEQKANTTVYRGNWNELTAYLEDQVPEGRFKPMEVFDIDEVESVEELDQILDELNEKYEEIREDFNEYEEKRKEGLKLSKIQGDNEERFRKLKDLRIIDEDTEVEITAVEDPETSEVSMRLDASRGSFLTVLDSEWEKFTEVLEKHNLNDENLTKGFKIISNSEPPETLEELDRRFNVMKRKGEELKQAYKVRKSLREQMEQNFLSHNPEEREQQLRKFMEEWDIGKLQETIGELEKYPIKPDLRPEEYEHPEMVEDAFHRELKQEWGLSDDSVEKLENCDHENYIISSMSQTIREDDEETILDRASSLFGRSEETTEEEIFIQEFMSGASEEYLHGAGFQQRYFTDGEEIVDTDEEVRESAYEEGLELLGRIARGQGEIYVEDQEIEELEDELNHLIEQISSSQGRPDQNLIERKNEIKSELPERRREKAFEELGLNYSPEGNYDHLDPHELGQALDQLAQENLQGDESNPETAAGKAKSLSGPLNSRTDVGNGYVDFELWDKNLNELPSTDRRVPCTFPGGSAGDEFINYMRDPGTQIAMLEAGEDEGAVISNLVEYQGEDMLLVHSVESDDGITSRKHISKAIRDHIEDYAEETGMEGIIYSTGTHNTAAQNFLEATVQNDSQYHEKNYEVEKIGREDIRLDFELPEVEGYMTKLQ